LRIAGNLLFLASLGIELTDRVRAALKKANSANFRVSSGGGFESRFDRLKSHCDVPDICAFEEGLRLAASEKVNER